MIARRCLRLAALAVLTLPVLGQAQNPVAGELQQSASFDGRAAWAEFEMLLREAYAYIDRDDIDVDAQLQRSRALAANAPNAQQFRRIIHQTALTFMDPHLIVGPFTDDDYAIIMTAADMDVAFVDGWAIVRDVRRGSPAFEAGIRPGDRLVLIDGKPATEAARLPFGDVLPEPSAAQLDYGVTIAANGKRGSGRVLRVRRGNERERTVELISTSDYDRSLDDRPSLTVEFVGEQRDVAVIRILNSLGNNDTIAAFDAAVAEVTGARALVLDLRETPSGGNTEVARSIIGHFVTETRPYQMHRNPAVERAFTVPRQFVEYVAPREPHFSGPVFVLHGRWTGSMGEGVVIGMDAATEATTIGSNMGDLLGALWNRDLPASGARVDFAGESLFHVNGTPRDDYVAQMPTTPIDTAPDGSDPGIAAVLAILEKAN